MRGEASAAEDPAGNGGRKSAGADDPRIARLAKERRRDIRLAAAAIAFLKLFEARGWGVGTARVAYRIWQLYWCHIGVFFATLAALIVVDQTLVDAHRNYVGVLNLSRFVRGHAAYMPSMFTHTYVPN